MAEKSPSGAELRVLTVCTGNVCRSPTVERLLRMACDGTIDVTSAGTRAVDGAPMDPRAASELDRLGGSSVGFEARRLTVAAIESADVVLTATLSHRATVCSAVPRAVRRTFTVKELALLFAELAVGDEASKGIEAVASASLLRSRLAGRPHADLELDDPINGPDALFGEIADEIAAAVDQLARRFD